MSYRDLCVDSYFFNKGHRVSADSVTVEGTHRFDSKDIIFDGHFPGDPIVPGVIVLLGMLAGARMLLEGADSQAQANLSSVVLERMRLKRILRPGDMASFRVSIVHRDLTDVNFKGTVFLGSERTAYADFTFRQGGAGNG